MARISWFLVYELPRTTRSRDTRFDSLHDGHGLESVGGILAWHCCGMLHIPKRSRFSLIEGYSDCSQIFCTNIPLKEKLRTLL